MFHRRAAQLALLVLLSAFVTACRCGAPNCLGYMVAEEFFPEVKRRVAERK